MVGALVVSRLERTTLLIILGMLLRLTLKLVQKNRFANVSFPELFLESRETAILLLEILFELSDARTKAMDLFLLLVDLGLEVLG